MIELLAISAETEYSPMPEPAVRRLVRQARQGGEPGRAAMQELILRNIHLIRKVVSKYRYLTTETVTSDDLFQIACLSFMNAVEKFDPRRGVKFCTYAVVSMRRGIMRCLDNSDRIRIPVHIQLNKRRAGSVAAQLTAAGGRAPTRAALASASGLSDRKLERLANLPRITASLDDPRGDKEQDTLGELLPDPEPADLNHSLDRAALVAFLQAKLAPRQYHLLALHFGLHPLHPDGLSYDELASKYGVSRQNIQQRLQVVISLLGDGLAEPMRALLQPDERAQKDRH